MKTNPQTNIAMAAYTSMKTGGIAAECYFPETEEALLETVRRLVAEKKRYHILGNMSNVLLPDETVPFVPVVTTKIRAVTLAENADGTVDVYAAAGVSLTRLAYEMCLTGYAGMEFAYGIPGSVGGAVFMNAGAYGSEIGNIARSVKFYDTDADAVLTVPAADCAFGYRASVFQQKNGAILGAAFTLAKGNREEILARAKEILQKRIDKQPLEFPSCGSAFKRPEGYFAGDLIERSGLKGAGVGGAYVSEKHAGFIVNKGGATTADVVSLLAKVQKTVRENFGVDLEPEIRVLE